MPVGPAGEVERVAAVEVDVLVGERGDVLDLAGGDELAGGAELVEDAAGVDGVPGDDRVDDDRQAQRLPSLLVGRALADVPFVCVEDGAAQRVQLLAFVELAADAGAELFVGEPRSTKLVLVSRPYSCRAWASGLRRAVAAAAAFLLGSEAGFITGSDLLMDGGVIAALRAGRWSLAA